MLRLKKEVQPYAPSPRARQILCPLARQPATPRVSRPVGTRGALPTETNGEEKLRSERCQLDPPGQLAVGHTQDIETCAQTAGQDAAVL